MSQREKTPYYRGAKVGIHLASPRKPHEQGDWRVQCIVLREETTDLEFCVLQTGGEIETFSVRQRARELVSRLVLQDHTRRSSGRRRCCRLETWTHVKEGRKSTREGIVKVK